MAKVKWRRPPVALIVIVVLAAMIIPMIVYSIQTGDLETNDLRIFADISECENIAQYKHDDAEITLMDKPGKKEPQEYQRFYGATYQAKSLEFTITAYEFADVEASQAYFEDKVYSTEFETTFSVSTGMGGITDIVVIDHQNAYYIRTTAKYYKELMTLLKQCFSVEVMEIISARNSA